jgi:hypothetical protein
MQLATSTVQGTAHGEVCVLRVEVRPSLAKGLVLHMPGVAHSFMLRTPRQCSSYKLISCRTPTCPSAPLWSAGCPGTLTHQPQSHTCPGAPSLTGGTQTAAADSSSAKRSSNSSSNKTTFWLCELVCVGVRACRYRAVTAKP